MQNVHRCVQGNKIEKETYVLNRWLPKNVLEYFLPMARPNTLMPLFSSIIFTIIYPMR